MSDKAFSITLAIILAVCVVCTFALVAYTAYLYDNVSIITYISNER